jgi:hypothetical protein
MYVKVRTMHISKHYYLGSVDFMRIMGRPWLSSETKLLLLCLEKKSSIISIGSLTENPAKLARLVSQIVDSQLISVKTVLFRKTSDQMVNYWIF